MGKSHTNLRRFDEAMSNFKKVIELTPKFSEGYKNLGFVYVLKEDWPNAIRLYSEALSLNPNDDNLKKIILKYDYAFSSENVIVVVSTQAVRNQSNIWDSQNQRLKR